MSVFVCKAILKFINRTTSTLHNNPTIQRVSHHNDLCWQAESCNSEDSNSCCFYCVCNPLQSILSAPPAGQTHTVLETEETCCVLLTGLTSLGNVYKLRHHMLDNSTQKRKNDKNSLPSTYTLSQYPGRSGRNHYLKCVCLSVLVVFLNVIKYIMSKI